MIFLDTNLFLRLFTTPANSNEARFRNAAVALFALIDSGEVDATTSELVIHEVSYVLRSKRQYALTTDATIAVVEQIVANQRLQVPRQDRSVWLDAIEIWKANTKLGFADCVIVARCQANDWELATLDRKLARLAPRTWSMTNPESTSTNGSAD